MNTLSKKKFLIGGILLGVLGIILGRMSDGGSCGQIDICLLAAYPLLAFVPVFIFSLVTYFLKDEVFASWRKVTILWLITTIILVVISPTEHADLIGFEKKSALFFLTCLYSLISLILIAYKSYRLRGK